MAERDADDRGLLATGAAPASYRGDCRHLKWEALTLWVLWLTWVACYFCRDHLFVLMSAFKDAEGVHEDGVGAMMAAGYLSYFAGKLLWGVFTDRYGGRAAVLLTVLGTSAASAAFAVSRGYPAFLLLWMALRLLQPAGWIGLVKVASMWVPWTRAGCAMALLSLSIPLGDVVARLSLSGFITLGMDWRSVMLWSAATTASAAVLDFTLLRNDPTALGLPPVPSNPDSAYAKPRARRRTASGGAGTAATVELAPIAPTAVDVDVDAEDEEGDGSADGDARDADGAAASDAAQAPPPPTVLTLLRPLLRNSKFLLVCTLSLLFTAVRETLNTYLASYLYSLGATDSEAAALSALMPFFGAPATLICGVLFDCVPHRWRGAIVPIMFTPAFVAVLLIVLLPDPSIDTLSKCISVVGFGLLGPYSLLAGAFAIEIGGDTGAGTVSALVDAAGYVGAIAMMVVRATGADFDSMFMVLAVLAGAVLVAGVALTAMLRRAS